MPRNKLHSTKLYKQFGERLKALRKELEIDDGNISQERLAELINVSYDSIKNWEQGYSMPDHENMIKLCDIFQCSMDYLYGRTDFDTASIDLSEDALLHLIKWCSLEPYRTVISDLFEDERLILEIAHTSATTYGLITEMVDVEDPITHMHRSKFIRPEDIRNGDLYSACEHLKQFILSENERINPTDFINEKNKKAP